MTTFIFCVSHPTGEIFTFKKYHIENINSHKRNNFPSGFNARVPIIAENTQFSLYYYVHVSCHVQISWQISALFIYLICGINSILYSSISTYFWLKLNPVHDLRFTGSSSSHYCHLYLFVIFR